ncbi:UxaA family hydrolase [Roseobacter weihaiensis]|uniref:UxaA family hydrolase n=1 Tax=Roseobacter weihaiensis TaxID=2763262 RepID=UPI001D0AEA7D|nr:UxaA family hydrolase [Roseobacter sp. H9]
MSTISHDVPIGSGWRRSDGRVGLRNHVIAFSTVALTDRITSLAAARVKGVLPICPAFQRGLRGADAALQANMIKAVIAHPNVGAALIVTHDRAAAETLEADCLELGKPIIVLSLIAQAGMQSAQDAMVAHLQALKAEIAESPKTALHFSDLTVALECGGSDATSALAANPAIGRFVDRLIAAGGTAIVSETAEFLGGEAVIRAQSQSEAIAQDILGYLCIEEQMMRSDGTNYRGVNPTAENIEAGLSTLTEKTMGAFCKIGSNRFAGALPFGERPPVAGLHFMHTPFFSPTSLTGMVLGGAQISLFAMGVYNPSGMPLAPTVKICGNPKTLSNWPDGIDLDVSEIITGGSDYDDAANTILKLIGEIAGGKDTRAEEWREGQIIIPISQLPL